MNIMEVEGGTVEGTTVYSIESSSDADDLTPQSSGSGYRAEAAYFAAEEPESPRIEPASSRMDNPIESQFTTPPGTPPLGHAAWRSFLKEWGPRHEPTLPVSVVARMFWCRQTPAGRWPGSDSESDPAHSPRSRSRSKNETEITDFIERVKARDDFDEWAKAEEKRFIARQVDYMKQLQQEKSPWVFPPGQIPSSSGFDENHINGIPSSSGSPIIMPSGSDIAEISRRTPITNLLQHRCGFCHLAGAERWVTFPPGEQQTRRSTCKNIHTREPVDPIVMHCPACRANYIVERS